jgi:hypothetical protein
MLLGYLNGPDLRVRAQRGLCISNVTVQVGMVELPVLKGRDHQITCEMASLPTFKLHMVLFLPVIFCLFTLFSGWELQDEGRGIGIPSHMWTHSPRTWTPLPP